MAWDYTINQANLIKGMLHAEIEFTNGDEKRIDRRNFVSSGSLAGFIQSELARLDGISSFINKFEPGRTELSVIDKDIDRETYFRERGKLVRLREQYDIDVKNNIIADPDNERLKVIGNQDQVVRLLYKAEYEIS